VEFVGGPPRFHWHFFARSAFLLGYTRGALGNGYSAGAEDLLLLQNSNRLRAASYIFYGEAFYQRSPAVKLFIFVAALLRKHQQTKNIDDDMINQLPLSAPSPLDSLTQVCFRKPRVILTASLIHCLFFPSPF
jgi:hypothetical protein